MTFILCSYLKLYIRDEQGEKIPVALEDENQIFTNIKKYTKNKNRFVLVSNNPDNYEDNDKRFNIFCEGLKKSELLFKESVLLDGRNKNNAREILEKADLMILCGGKCLCQNKFFKEIKMKEILEESEALIIGISAGTMNLCENVYNFPEENMDLKERRWIKGLGFCKDIVVPHFNGEDITYQIPCEEIDVVNDYILPTSMKKDLVGLPNDSYILINEEGMKLFGNVYKISKGKCEKID